MKVRVDSLRRYFGRTRAVDGISFGFDAGQIFGFVGPNGAGKTTTMRIMATLDDPTAGDVFVDGVSVTQYPEQIRRMVGFVPDTLPGLGDTTVREYLDFFARAYSMRGATRRKAVEAVEEFTGLSPIRGKLLKALSKGMKQRVSLARALIHDPSVLIMDEPAAGLDPRARIELRELLAILAGQGKTVFISSHILSELTEICHGVVIIERGRIIEQGVIRDVMARSMPRRGLLIKPLEQRAELCRALMERPEIKAVREAGDEVCAELDGDDEACATLLGDLVGAGFRLVEFRHKRVGLEDVFMSLTRGGLDE